MRLVKSEPLLHIVYSSGITYPVPPSINYFWNFGSISLLCLGLQFFTGIFLAMYYTGHVDLAFESVEHIMRDIPFGWLLRYAHANGASLFFLAVYIHLFRGLYYGSYLSPRDKLWISGIVILFIMIGTAFMGYVLPWGQMSFWAATVITNLASAIPFIGNDIVIWFWGSFSVDVPTLNRFFALHYLFPFVLAALVVIHLLLLHEYKSGDPLGLINLNVDRIPLSPYFLIKDLLGFVLFFFIFLGLVFFYPNLLGHPDNYILANPMVTPAHIVPEWYFLPFYAVLRSIPDKLQGVILMLLSIIILAIFPFFLNFSLQTNLVSKSGVFKSFYKIVVKKLVFVFIVLGWIGGQPVLEPFVFIGRFAMFLYFFICIFMFYFVYLYDSTKYTQWFEIEYFKSKNNFSKLINDKNFNYKNIKKEWSFTYNIYS